MDSFGCPGSIKPATRHDLHSPTTIRVEIPDLFIGTFVDVGLVGGGDHSGMGGVYFAQFDRGLRILGVDLTNKFEFAIVLIEKVEDHSALSELRDDPLRGSDALFKIPVFPGFTLG